MKLCSKSAAGYRRMSFDPSKIVRDLDRQIPVPHVLAQTEAFLERCGWKLEIDSEILEIPRDGELVVRSRAFVKDEQGDVFLGDHFEVVLIGKRPVGDDLCASHAVLKLYFNLEGQLVSEDRYDRYR